MINLFVLEPMNLFRFMSLCEKLEESYSKSESVNLLIKHNGYIEPSYLSILFEKIQSKKISFSTSALGKLQMTDFFFFLLGDKRIIYPNACIDLECLDIEAAISPLYLQNQMKSICNNANIDLEAIQAYIKEKKIDVFPQDCIKYGIAHQIGGNLNDFTLR